MLAAGTNFSVFDLTWPGLDTQDNKLIYGGELNAWTLVKKTIKKPIPPDLNVYYSYDKYKSDVTQFSRGVLA